MDIGARGFSRGLRIRHMGRMVQIVNVFARHGLWSVMERLGIERWLTPEQVRSAEAISRTGDAQKITEDVAGGLNEGDPHEVDAGKIGIDLTGVHGLPARLRRAFEELGPAFVKLGQVLAVREDLLPVEYTEELRKLHTKVEPLPFEQIQKRLAEELSPELLADFEFISPRPIAAGSIGQVHEGMLKSGERVAIKVQRPNISEQISVDLSLMESLAAMFERYIPESAKLRPRAMITEFSRAIQGELDFVREAGSTTKIAANFANVPWIKIPKVYWQYSTARVLTLEHIDGVASDNRDEMVRRGFSPPLLVERGLSMFLQMVFVDGLFHGDLHPGNILALPDNQVGVLDFGMVVRISRTTREHLAGLLVALVEEDFERMVQHFVELSDPAADFNLETFQYDIANAVAPFVGLRLKAIRSGGVLWDLAKIAARHGVPLPQELIVFLKTLVSFEGVGTRLDPDFDLIRTCEKFTVEIVKGIYSPDNIKQNVMVIARDLTSLMRLAPLQVRRLLKSALDGQLRVNIGSEEINRVATALDRSSSRLAVSIIIAALLIGSSILTYARAGQELWHLPLFGLLGFSLAGILGFYVVWSVLRGGRM
jgi:ubiquinone biosynthesis protein